MNQRDLNGFLICLLKKILDSFLLHIETMIFDWRQYYLAAMIYSKLKKSDIIMTKMGI